MRGGFGRQRRALAFGIVGLGVGFWSLAFLVSGLCIAKLRLYEIHQTADGREVVGKDEETGNEEDPTGHYGQDETDDADDDQADPEQEAAEMS
jgi:hypothetical protein